MATDNCEFGIRYDEIMKDVDSLLTEWQSEICSLEESDGLIARCSSLSDAIEADILTIFKIIRLKFPELEASVSDPIDYAGAVKQMGCNAFMDTLCDKAISLDAGKKRLVDFVATRIGSVAPNLSAFAGTSVAAKLVVEAGGLRALAKMSSANMAQLGLKRMISTGFATRASGRVGYIGDTDVYQKTPELLRKRLGWLVAMSTAAAAGVDNRKSEPLGEVGRHLHKHISGRVERLNKLGGRRLRKEMTKLSYGSVKLGLRAAAKFKKQRSNASSSSSALAQELANQFAEMAVSTQSTSFAPSVEFSKMNI